MIDSNADDLIAHLRELATRQPSMPALVAPNRTPMTFAALATRIDAVEARLSGWGFCRGDVVAWPAVGRVETAAAFAMLPAAATLAPLAPQLGADAYAALLRRLRPKAVALPAGLEHVSREVARQLGISELAIVPARDGSAGDFSLELVVARRSLEGAPALDGGVAYVSTTSGMTGSPKLVPHGHRQVMATARCMRERLGLGPRDVSGHVAPMHMANGLRASYLLALLNGGAVACLPEADVGALLAAIESGEVTYTSASVTLLREVLLRCEAGQRVEPARLRFLRTASGRLECEEIRRLEQVVGVPVITGLSSTETGIVAHQAPPPASRRIGSVGPVADCEVRLVDDAGHEVARGEIGEIEVRGPQVFDGYIDVVDQAGPIFVGGWYRMGDLGRFDDAGELHVVGRVKDIINRGGEKLSPSAIDAAMRAVPGVVDAAAFGVPHPRLGEELVAAVVRAPGSDVSEEAIGVAVRALHGPRSTPRQFWFVASLPRNDAGKLLRQTLPGWVLDHTTRQTNAGEHAGDGATSPMEIALAALWAAVLEQPAVPPNTNFFMLGGDSLRGAQLLRQVRAAFGVELTLDLLFASGGTVAGMARLIEEQRSVPHPAGRAAASAR